MARADHLPLVLPVMGATDLPRGAQVMLRLGEIDDISLDVHGQLVSWQQSAPHANGAGGLAQGDLDNALGDDFSDDDDDSAAGPIAIAMDLNDTDGPASTEAAAP